MALPAVARSVDAMLHSTPVLGAQPVIQTVGLTKHYGATLALDRLDLTIEAGEIYGFLGPNGAGKTTTIRLLLGLHRATTGRAALFGLDAFHEPVAAHRRVAYVAGEPGLWPALTGDETLELLAGLHGATDTAYRDQLVARFALDTRKRVRTLSKGNRQKVALVAALATRADLLILDEPTTGLDPLMEVAFRDTIKEAKERGQTVFLSSHILSEVEALCDRVGILRAGRLVDDGTLSQLRHLSAQTVEVSFDGATPTLPMLPGVSVTTGGPNALRIEVTGPIAPLIDQLAGLPITSLVSREPSLEEIFVHHYQDKPAHVGG
jgi:polyether ionophore transport system ATP-binding protein